MTIDADLNTSELLTGAVQSGPRKRLTVRLVRTLLPLIEAELAKGTSHREILSRLAAEGYEATWAYYQLMLHRVRKEVAAGRRESRASAPDMLDVEDRSEHRDAGADHAPHIPQPQRTEVTWDVKSPITW